MGDALRFEGRCKDQLEFTLNSGGRLVTKGLDFKIFDASSGAVPQFAQTAHTAVCLQHLCGAQPSCHFADPDDFGGIRRP